MFMKSVLEFLYLSDDNKNKGQGLKALKHWNNSSSYFVISSLFLFSSELLFKSIYPSEKPSSILHSFKRIQKHNLSHNLFPYHPPSSPPPFPSFTPLLSSVSLPSGLSLGFNQRKREYYSSPLLPIEIQIFQWEDIGWISIRGYPTTGRGGGGRGEGKKGEAEN